MIKFIIVFIILFIITLPFILLCRSAKYEYIMEKDENGVWHSIPVCHPCGEPIDEDFIKLWNEREKQYEEEMKGE